MGNKDRNTLKSIMVSDLKFWTLFAIVVYLMVLMSSCTDDNPGYTYPQIRDMVMTAEDMDSSIMSQDMQQDMRREKCKVFAGISCENQDMSSICGVLFKCVCTDITGCCCSSL